MSIQRKFRNASWLWPFVLLLFFGDLADPSPEILGLQRLVQDALLYLEQLLLPLRLPLLVTVELKLQSLDLSLQLLFFIFCLVYFAQNVSNFCLVFCQFIRSVQGTLQCLSEPICDLPLQILQKLSFSLPHQPIPFLLYLFKLLILPYIFLLQPLPPPQTFQNSLLHLPIPANKHSPEPPLYGDYLTSHQVIILHIFLFLIVGVLPLVLFLYLEAEGSHVVGAFRAG